MANEQPELHSTNERRALRKSRITGATHLLPDLANIICDYSIPSDSDALRALLDDHNDGLVISLHGNRPDELNPRYSLAITRCQLFTWFNTNTYSASIKTPGWFQPSYNSIYFTMDTLFDANKLWRTFYYDSDYPLKNNVLHGSLNATFSAEYTKKLWQKLGEYR